MRNAKLWSVLLAAVLLCACVVGVLFVGASASDSRIPTATTTYVVGTDGDTIAAVLAKAQSEPWGATAVLEIQFSGTDGSVQATTNTETGRSSKLLFGQTTIFREDGSKLPIVIRGMDEDKAATIATPAGSYACANDYIFTNLTIAGGTSGNTVIFYAGSGNVVFEETKHTGLEGKYTYYYGDNNNMDSFYGWDSAKVTANQNADGLIETSLTFGNGTTIPSVTNQILMAAVGNNSANNETIYNMRNEVDTTTYRLTDAQVKAAEDAAPLATYHPGVLVTENCAVKPYDTKASLVLDNGTKAPTAREFPIISARYGVAPVREVVLELISGGVHYIAGGTDGLKSNGVAINEVTVGDTDIIVRGGKTISDEVGIRIINTHQMIGDLTFEFHEDDPEIPTYTSWLQGEGNDSGYSCVYGNYKFYMTGGTMGTGSSGNDGYWGAPNTTGEVINEVEGGHLWRFCGYRFDLSHTETPFSVALSNEETINEKAAVRNIIKGGTFGGVDADGKVVSGKGFYGGEKDSPSTTTFYSGDAAVICNEISGGTFYGFNAAHLVKKTQDTIYNIVSGSPVFKCDFVGSNVTGGTTKIVNVISGTPTFEGSVIGSAKGSEDTAIKVTEIKNYILGGTIPTFYGTYYCTVDSVTNTVSGGTVGTYELDGSGKVNATTRTFYSGAYYSTVSGKVTNTVNGGTIYTFYGIRGGSADEVENTVEEGTIGLDKSISDSTAYYFGTHYAKARIVRNNFNGGLLYSIRGTNDSSTTSNTIEEVYNTIDGADIKRGFNGTYSISVTTKIQNEVLSGSISGAFYSAFNRKFVVGAIENYISGGTFASGDIILGGYGGDVSSVYNKISGDPEFNNSSNTTWFGSGSKNWPTKVGCVINEISGGTFKSKVYGGGGSAYVTIKIDTTIEDGNFTNNFYGGNTLAYVAGNAIDEDYIGKSIEGEIINTIKGGNFTNNFYGGSACDESSLSITNQFSGGQFNASSNRQIYLGNNGGTMVGTITSEFYDGFDAGISYVHGGGAATLNAPEGAEYVITNTIHGGNFKGFWGVGGGGDAIVTGNVKTTVNGGTFDVYSSSMTNSFAGGHRNATLNGNVVSEINGGTFKGKVAGTAIIGSSTYDDRDVNGTASLTINGGIFYDDIYAESPTETSIATEGATLTITATTDKALTIYGEVADCTTFTGNGGTVEIGKNTNIVAADATGTVTFKQTEGWLAHDYFKAEGASISVTVEEAEGIFGAYDPTTLALVLVTGKGIDASGVTLILDERLGVRFLFDKALVDQYGDEFTYEFTMEKADGTYTFEGGYDDLELYTDSEGNQYWSFIAYGIGLRDFGTTFSVTGSALNSLKDDRDSIVELAQIAKGSWTGEWLAYAEAVENFHKVYIQDPNWTALEPAVPEKTEVSAVKGEAYTSATSATAGLAMGDAVAVSFELKLAEAPTNFTVKVNGNPIENAATIVTGEGETTVTVDLYFHAKHMAADFEIVLSSDAGTYFTYKGSVAAMAYQLATAETDGTTITETTKANANALLYYIEKTVACANL